MIKDEFYTEPQKSKLMRYVGNSFCNEHLLKYNKIYELRMIDNETVGVHEQTGEPIGTWYPNDAKRMFVPITKKIN